MKHKHTSDELRMRSAPDSGKSSSHPLSAGPAVDTILRHIREGHLSHLTAALIVLLIVAAFGFAFYFVTSDSDAVQQARIMLESSR